MKTIQTQWRVRTYDVWGNAREGWEVNDVSRQWEVSLELTVQDFNIGMPSGFQAAYIPNATLKHIFNLGHGTRLETDGDDITYYVNRATDGFPIGELVCLSHQSLSPIKPIEGQAPKGWSMIEPGTEVV